MLKKFAVHVELDPMRGCHNIFIFERHSDKLFTAKPQEIVMIEVKDYKPGYWTNTVKPFLSIDHLYSHDFLHELAEQLDKLGFKFTKDEEELKSVLKAKDRHLEDMRNLVFKVKK